MQTLKIKNFLGIKDAKIDLDGLTVLIGEQASGKSVIARLFYFFSDYFSGLEQIALLENMHKRTYDASKRENFSKIFPSYSWIKIKFEITFSYNDHTITLSSEEGSEKLKILTSQSVTSYFSELKRDFQNFLSSYNKQNYPRFMILSEYNNFRNKTIDKSKLSAPLHGAVLFVPAARSFFATIREEIFSILSMDEKIDQIILQFGRFYENAKRDTGFRRSMSKEKGSLLPTIIKGSYSRKGGRDWITMESHEVELSKASSGQQEALPLLAALTVFPAPGKTLIIEEPEAHLFPESQVSILNYIVSQCVDKETNILFTTHSPYLLSALNNCIEREARGKIPGVSHKKINAYSIVSGLTESIVDMETNLISAGYIDSISDKILEDFIALVEESKQ